MCKCNRTGLFLHGGALGGAVVVVGSATQIGLLTHLHRPSPPRRRRRLRCRPRIKRRRLSASTPLVRAVVDLLRRDITFPLPMVQGARCCFATCPGVLRVGGVRYDGGERRLLAMVRAGRNAAVRVMKLGPQSTPDDVQRVRHGGVSTQRRPLAADGLGGRRRPPLVAGQPHVTLRIKKIAERRTIWGAAAPRGPNSPRRAAAAKRIFQGAQEGKSQRPGGFLGPSCGCRASTGRAFCRRATRPNRTARGSKPTDLVLSGPSVYPLC